MWSGGGRRPRCPAATGQKGIIGAIVALSSLFHVSPDSPTRGAFVAPIPRSSHASSLLPPLGAFVAPIPSFFTCLLPAASTRGQCTFTARVPDEDIRGLAAYVLERAEAGWAVETPQ